MSKVEKTLLQKYEELGIALLEEHLGYSFKNKLLIVKALSHPSLKQIHDFKLYFAKQKLEFEKLEFLGDAVLNLSITQLLLDSYPHVNEGTLAKFKNHLVSKKIITKIAIALDIKNFLILTQGEIKSGGKTNLNNLENAVEALLGAIYLDSDFCVVIKVINMLWREQIENIGTLALDPKGSLQEVAHLLSLGIPQYLLLSQTGKQNDLTFEIQVSLGENLVSNGVGKTKKEAEIQAAQILLRLLSN